MGGSGVAEGARPLACRSDWRQPRRAGMRGPGPRPPAPVTSTRSLEPGKLDNDGAMTTENGPILCCGQPAKAANARRCLCDTSCCTSVVVRERRVCLWQLAASWWRLLLVGTQVLHFTWPLNTLTFDGRRGQGLVMTCPQPMPTKALAKSRQSRYPWTYKEGSGLPRIFGYSMLHRAVTPPPRARPRTTSAPPPGQVR